MKRHGWTTHVLGASAALLLGVLGLAISGTAGAQDLSGYDSGSTSSTSSTSSSSTSTTGETPTIDECIDAVPGLQLVSATLAPGRDFVVSGSGFAPGLTINIYICSSPVLVGTAVADSAGGFEGGGTVPADLASGEHLVIAVGLDEAGDVRYQTADFSVETQNCDEIGQTDIPQSSDLYRSDLDSDGDGIACEANDLTSSPGSSPGTTPTDVQGTQQSNTPAATQGTSALSYTGSSAGTIAVVAAAIVLLGSALVLAARRRRTAA